MYSVYCHIFPNGKRYVGVTKNSLEKRWGCGANYASCPLVFRAIQKYGWESIQHEVLFESENLSDAEEMEKHYISAYDTQNPEKGYNILPGGDISQNSPTEEIRRKMGNGRRGKKWQEADKERIGQSVKKVFQSRPESNGHFGMRHSEETKEKMSSSQKRKWEGDAERRDSARDRMRARMSEPEYRKKVLDNLAKQPKRKKGEWTMPESGKEKISRANVGKWVGAKSPCSKPVLQYTKAGELVKRWENASEVERAGIAKRGNISKCCHGAKSVKSVAGYVWRFESQN